MATTATPYGSFITAVLQAKHDVLNNPLSVALLTSSYTPDYTNDYYFTSFQQYEIANDTATGGYLVGGLPLANRAVTYDGAGAVATLAADPVSWSALSATFRYAVILDKQFDSTGLMLGLINFGADRVYNAEPFTLSFPGGVMTLSAA